MKALKVFAVAMLLVITGIPSAAVAEPLQDDICPPNLESVTVGNLIVLENSFCSLRNVEVLGDIQIQEGGTVVAYGIFVHGSIFSNSANTVFISHSVDPPSNPSLIKGNVRLLHSESAQIVLSVIEGNLLLLGNIIGLSNSSEIYGNLVLINNETAQLSNNWVGQNLICSQNENFTSVTGGNQVEGNTIGQCSVFD